MNRKLVIAVLVAIALGVAAYVVFRDNTPRSPAKPAAGNTGASARSGSAGSPAGSAPDPHAPPPPTEPENPETPFLQARSRAMATLQSDLTQRISTCAPAGATPPRPRPLRLALEWRPEASTPEMQQYMVTEVTVVGGNADDIGPVVRACIDQLRGMPVTVFVKTDAIASEDRTMDATFEIPLP